MLDRVSRACLAVRFTAKNGDSWGWKNLRELNFHWEDGFRGVTIWLKHAPGITWQGGKKIAASSKMTVMLQLL